MKVQRRTNLLWGVVFLATAILVLLGALGILPPGIADLVGRAWPVLLVLGGLSIFLRDRVPFGGFIALVISGALVAGVTVARPLLNVRREALREYLNSIGQPWREDASNASGKYSRNRLRALLASEPGLTRSLLGLSVACRRLRDWVRSAATTSIKAEYRPGIDLRKEARVMRES